MINSKTWQVEVGHSAETCLVEKLNKVLSMNKRIEREKRTVSKMIGMYCKKYHGMNGKLCDACQELNDYALKRIDYCRFGENKPACSICPVHCYKPEKLEQIREVMRFAGPRMMYSHPYLAIMHLIDKNRKSNS